MLYKKAQISDTMVWIVATLIIIIVLVVSIYAASLGGFFKGSRKVADEQQADLLVTKSMVGYLRTGSVYEDLKNEESPIKLGKFTIDFDKTLAKNVFLEDFNKYFSDYRWIGVVFTEPGFEKDIFFGDGEKSKEICKTNIVSTHKDICVQEEIKIDNKKKLVFIGVKRIL